MRGWECERAACLELAPCALPVRTQARAINAPCITCGSNRPRQMLTREPGLGAVQ